MFSQLALLYSVIVLSLSCGNFGNVLNCTEFSGICLEGCNESKGMTYSATFCEIMSGNCICDCRDILSSNCTRDPDSDCNLYCERKNPNPEVFTYTGSYCPVHTPWGDRGLNISNDADNVCACMCSLNPDYEEVNHI